MSSDPDEQIVFIFQLSGEIYFDDSLVRKDGLFVLPELESLNPENLTPILRR